MTRVLVCGGRDFADHALLAATLDVLAATRGVTAIINGAARGADAMSGAWARARGVGLLEFQADWSRFGRAAGPIRNRRMITDGRPDLVVAFPGGAGTRNMMTIARHANIEVVEVAAPLPSQRPTP